MMYFFDPRHGNRRRALMRDRVISVLHDTDDLIDRGVRDTRNRARGMLAEALGRLSEGESDDWVTAERVRSEIGRFIPYSRSIDVDVADGKATLRGQVLENDLGYLMAKVSVVKGVKDVENQLEVHQTAEGIPALQIHPQEGTGTMGGRSWSPTARLLSSLTGSALLVFGTVRGGFVGATMTTAGLGLAARGLTNKPLSRLVGLEKDEGVIHVDKTIHVNAPVEEVFSMWENFENFPRFMDHLVSVTDLGGSSSHWVAKGPAGLPVEWDAVVTEMVPGEEIAWRSVPESTVVTDGRVKFRQGMEDGTDVMVHLRYTPPAGALGHAVARLFGEDPKTAMDEDLVRFKSLIETGKTTSGGKKVKRDDI